MCAESEDDDEVCSCLNNTPEKLLHGCPGQYTGSRRVILINTCYL